MKGSAMLPSPTTRRQVSGRNRKITRNITPEAPKRNQNIDGQLQRMRRSPLISGATLGGVVRLVREPVR